jgi:hypothetical protein
LAQEILYPNTSSTVSNGKDSWIFPYPTFPSFLLFV